MKTSLFKIEEFNCNKCDSDNINFVKHEMKNGVYNLRKQCFECGYLNTLNYKRKFFKDFYKLPDVDLDLRNLNKENAIIKSNIKLIMFNYSQLHFERSLKYYRNVYLKSDEWKHKRKLIMDYYKWMCAKCDNKATDLHHITYDNIFKEKFDDLMPLCRNCHNKEHF
jgi:hypothetical protein